MRPLLALLFVAVASTASPARSWAETPSLPWQKWEPALFDRAAREDRYILLHMAAVWCHWCHVMEGTTYRDPMVQKTIAEKFIPVRVDQDGDPALSYRYENWGWPATVMLDRDGNEVFKRRGYIMRYLIQLAEDGFVVPGAVLADRELSREPAHVTVVGAKDDPEARVLYAAARAYPTRYLRIEWLDRREDPLPLSDVDYPDLPQAAAYACANGACSVPAFEAADVHRIAAKVDDR